MLYLDNASTSPVAEEAIHTVTEVLKRFYGNPSSLHRLGVQAEKVLRQSRALVAESLEVSPEEIIFTSGGTESCNLFLKGMATAAANRGRHILATRIEHPAVLQVIRSLEASGAYQVDWLDVDSQGRIMLPQLDQLIRPDETILAAIMHVNNETGAIQPVEEAARLIKEKTRNRAYVFVDGVQGYLKVPLDLGETAIDGYAISAHKVHGPKGVGALYLRKGIVLPPLLEGGGQERGLRSGTENVAGIAGFAKAVQRLDFCHVDAYRVNMGRRESFIEILTQAVPELQILGPDALEASPYIISCALPGVRGETVLHALEAADVFISTGSACSGKNKAYSHVLTAMGVREKSMMGAIRISMGLLEWPDEEEMGRVARVLGETYHRLLRR